MELFEKFVALQEKHKAFVRAFERSDKAADKASKTEVEVIMDEKHFASLLR